MNPVRIGIQIALAVAIVVLAIVLYNVITNPYEEYREQQSRVDQARGHMTVLRSALIYFERQDGRYPTTLDSVANRIRMDPDLRALPDSVFAVHAGVRINVDSLEWSPRTNQRFRYEVNQDTTSQPFYVLEDPDTGDQIGTLTDPLMRNAASWE